MSLTQTGLLPDVYATDEHVAIAAAGDFDVVAPDWQSLVRGDDGTFQTGDPWTLRSTLVDFEAVGLAPGDVVRLGKPLRGSGLLYAVESTTGPTALLRLVGRPAGQGTPPPLAPGVYVAFDAPSLAPQIEEASFDLNQRFGISTIVAGRAPANLADARDLRRACVLSVLAQRYGDAAREARGDFRAKFAALRDELSELLARLSIRWAPPAPSRTTTRFSTRLSR